MKITISDSALREGAGKGPDVFVGAVVDAISRAVGGELNAQSMERLSVAQLTLWGFSILHEEVMDGGFVQLIHNGYGPFFFRNPFAKVMALWGLDDFSKMLKKAGRLFHKREEVLTRECTDEEFMALFEQNPEFDELDDAFVETEEEIVAKIAEYVDEHLDKFVEIN